MNMTLLVMAIVLLTTSMCCCGLCGWGTPAWRTPEEGIWHCPPLPETFEEPDLIGTWRAQYGAATDTITLRNDGTYKQVYVGHTDGYSFETPWNRWWLEHRASGGLYLHLEGMRRCDFTNALCRQEGRGGGDVTYWDFCERRAVRMPGEIVVMVTGIPRGGGAAPRGIWLWHMALEPGSGGGDNFTLQEE